MKVKVNINKIKVKVDIYIYDINVKVLNPVTTLLVLDRTLSPHSPATSTWLI